MNVSKEILIASACRPNSTTYLEIKKKIINGVGRFYGL
jgi:hypothetical protein